MASEPIVKTNPVQIGRAQLWLGDCREILPSLPKVDAVVTDPPYGIAYKSSNSLKNSISTTGKKYSQGIKGDDVSFDPAPWLALGQCAFTGAQHFAERLPGGSYHVWNKRGPYAPLDQADGDLIWISGPKKALRVVDIVWRGICRTVENNHPIEHPMQKPVALMTWMIARLPEPAGIVLDPFMGSGTTGVAAMLLGRSFVGIELDLEHFATACRRLEQAQRQGDMFIHRHGFGPGDGGAGFPDGAEWAA